jgi:hypothetical protein
MSSGSSADQEGLVERAGEPESGKQQAGGRMGMILGMRCEVYSGRGDL